MTKGRLEAFSDGVIAIIITIMVLGQSVSCCVIVRAFIQELAKHRCHKVPFTPVLASTTERWLRNAFSPRQESQ